MTRAQALDYAARWADAWNRRDVEAVLALFADGVVFTSPTAHAVMGTATIAGRSALRDYWHTALARIASLRFTVDRVLWDPVSRELAIVYDSEINGRRRRVSENLVLGEDGLVSQAEVFHGVGS